MKKQILNLSMILLTSSLIVSCGGKKDEKASSNEEASSSAKSEVKEIPKTDTLTEVKKEEAAVDKKKADALIQAYEQAVESKAMLLNRPPMSMDAAMQAMDNLESEIKTLDKQITASQLSDEQKSRFAKAKAKNKSLG
jgi:hypothetical protein